MSSIISLESNGIPKVWIGMDWWRTNFATMRSSDAWNGFAKPCFARGERAAILLPRQLWTDIRGMGNRLRHAYDQIDARIIWSVVSNDLPGPKADAVTALEDLTDTENAQHQ